MKLFICIYLSNTLQLLEQLVLFPAIKGKKEVLCYKCRRSLSRKMGLFIYISTHLFRPLLIATVPCKSTFVTKEVFCEPYRL